MVKPVQTTVCRPGLLGRCAQKAIADLSNPKALAPVILLESSVLAGRCYHAEKRGGVVEFRERFIEEFLTALVWFFGVSSLNAAGDFIAKGFNLDTKIDVGKDKLSDEYGKLKKHIKSPLERFTDGKSKGFKDLLTRVKFSKILLCTLTSVYVVGSIIPKFKNSVTENNPDPNQNSIAASMFGGLFRGKSSEKQASKIINSNYSSMPKFLESARNTDMQFRGGLNLAALSHNLENDNIYKMLTVDTGIVGGRAINARNDDEKIEIIVRDVGSLYFYMASTHHVAHFLSDDKFNFFGDKNARGVNLNKRMGISTNLDPRIVQYLNEQMVENFGSNTKSKQEFEIFMTEIFGRENKELVKVLKEQSTKAGHTVNLDDFLREVKKHTPDNMRFIEKNAINAAKLNNQVITGSSVMRIARHLEELDSKEPEPVADFIKSLYNESDRIYKATAEGLDAKVNNNQLIKMIDKLVELELPVDKEELDKAIKFRDKHLKQIKLEGDFVVTAQIEDVIHDGLVRKQSFFNEAFSKSNPDIKDPRKYVSIKSLSDTREHINSYAECLKENLAKVFNDKTEITVNDLRKALKMFQNKNLGMKALYTSIGLGVSAYFLSCGIPKFQYYITKKRTGNDDFPGVKGLNTAQSK